MIVPQRIYAYFLSWLTVMTFFSLVIGCGAVGSPIPPEDVGIEAKVRRQQQENIRSEQLFSEDETILKEEETVELPTFYPIRTR